MDRQLNVNKTILAMFAKRKYTDIRCSDSDGVIDDSDDVISKTFHILAKKPNGETVCAFAGIIQCVDVDTMRSIVSTMKMFDIEHGIFVYEIKTPPVKKFIVNLQNANIRMEEFKAQALQFDITTHRLAIPHTPLSKEESDAYKAKYGSMDAQLQKNDAMVRYYDIDSGIIVQILRPSGLIVHRIVK